MTAAFHPYAVAMEVGQPCAERRGDHLSLEGLAQEHIEAVVEHARRFLKAHEPVTAGR